MIVANIVTIINNHPKSLTRISYHTQRKGIWLIIKTTKCTNLRIQSTINWNSLIGQPHRQGTYSCYKKSKKLIIK